MHNDAKYRGLEMINTPQKNDLIQSASWHSMDDDLGKNAIWKPVGECALFAQI